MLHLIPVGKINAISRTSLQMLTGKSDRKIRRDIESLRQQGYPICMTTRGQKGYYLPKDDKEFEAFIREYESYPKTMFNTARQMKKRYYSRNQLKIKTASADIRKRKPQNKYYHIDFTKRKEKSQ